LLVATCLFEEYKFGGHQVFGLLLKTLCNPTFVRERSIRHLIKVTRITRKHTPPAMRNQGNAIADDAMSVDHISELHKPTITTAINTPKINSFNMLGCGIVIKVPCS